MKIKFIPISPMLGDATTWYNIDFNGTIEEFINEVINRDDNFVRIKILKDGEDEIFSSEPTYDFNFHKKAEDFPSEYLDKKPVRIKANGGWGNMEYFVWV